jgi:replication factor C large subunit
LSAVAAWQDWTEKHRPRALADLVGNGPAVKEMRAWAEEWQRGEPAEKALILAGEPGVGKTSAAHALARDLGWGVVELNASDQRNEEIIRRIAGAGATNRAFGADGAFAQGGRQLVILDEADNLFGREDRGGMKAILDTLRETKQPVVLIANDLYELQRRGASLKTLARTVKFAKVRSNSIPPALRRICEKEGVTLDVGVDEAIAERAGGDLRSAVNDLQALCAGRAHVTLADVEALGRRDTTGDVWGLLGKVFYGRDADEARKAAWDLDETPETIALWIDENLPVMYADRADLVEGYHYLGKASLMLGRVIRRQQYGLWSYATELMTSGVAVAKREKPAGARFQFPTWLRRQSTSKAVRELRDRTAEKVGNVLHTSRQRARNDLFPYLKQLLAADERFAAWCVWRFDLEADEIAFLLEDKATSARVKALLESSRQFEVYVVEAPRGFARYADAEPSGDEDEPQPPAPHATPAGVDEEDEEPPAKPAAASSGAEPGEKKRQRSLADF